MPAKTYSLEQFARKQAPVDAIVAMAISVGILLVILRGLDWVYAMPPPTGSGHSLFGSLFPMTIMTTMMSTIMGVRVTVKKRIGGEVTPPLDPGVRWFRVAFTTAVVRAFAVLGVISTLGFIFHSNWPLATISVQRALVVTAVVAAAMGYLESLAAVLKTRDL